MHGEPMANGGLLYFYDELSKIGSDVLGVCYYVIVLDVHNEMLQGLLIQLWEHVEVFVLHRNQGFTHSWTGMFYRIPDS